jgi:hypothetical protein
MRTLAPLALLFLAHAARADELAARVEYTLKTPRPRDPVLGGAKDTVAFTVWLPDGDKPVRGAVCNPFSKGDPPAEHWKAACRHWNFAYLQVDFDAVKKDEFGLLTAALADLAKRTKRPELEAAPLCFIGMSRGGGMSMTLTELLPARTIAAVPVCLEVGPTTEPARAVPVLTVFGEKDGQQMKLLQEKLPAARKDGARFATAVQWNRKHEFGQANNLAIAFLDDAVSRRVPAAPGPLRAVPLESGWLGDAPAWGKDGRLPAVAAWADYTGDRAAACWFPGARSAHAWRAFVGASADVKLSEPAGLGDGQKFAPHSATKPIAVKVTVAAHLKPTAVEVWDGDTKLAEKASGPFEFAVSLKPGVRPLYAVARTEGAARVSRPHTLIVGE